MPQRWSKSLYNLIVRRARRSKWSRKIQKRLKSRNQFLSKLSSLSLRKLNLRSCHLLKNKTKKKAMTLNKRRLAPLLKSRSLLSLVQARFSNYLRRITRIKQSLLYKDRPILLSSQILSTAFSHQFKIQIRRAHVSTNMHKLPKWVRILIHSWSIRAKSRVQIHFSIQETKRISQQIHSWLKPQMHLQAPAQWMRFLRFNLKTRLWNKIRSLIKQLPHSWSLSKRSNSHPLTSFKPTRSNQNRSKAPLVLSPNHLNHLEMDLPNNLIRLPYNKNKILASPRTHSSKTTTNHLEEGFQLGMGTNLKEVEVSNKIVCSRSDLSDLIKKAGSAIEDFDHCYNQRFTFI